MHEIVTEIMAYVQGAARFRWVAVVAAWLICLSGWVYVSQMPDRYQADARVHVDTRSMLRPLLSGLAVQTDVSGRIQLMSRLMFARPNLEKVARMTDLDLGVKSEEAMERLVKRLHSSMVIAGGQSDLFTIGFRDPDPKIAKKVVQALLTIFVEQTLGESREDSNTAQKFLEQQIKEYEVRLEAAEKAKENFKRANYPLMPGVGGNLYDQIQSLSASLDQARMAMQEAIRRRDEVRRQIEDDEPSYIDFANQGGASAGPLDTRIHALESRLDDLLLKYTRAHPEVVAVKKSLAELNRKRAEQMARMMTGSTEGEGAALGAWANPIFQQKKLALGEVEANIASIDSRIKTLESKIENLTKQMDDRLKVETALRGLNRDYDTLQDNYSKLLSRREQARMSESIEQNTDSVKFRIIDPPQVPTKPSSPDRVILSIGVLMIGILGGAGLAVFLALLRPAFSTVQKLREVAELPVLGSVSMNWIPDIRQRKWRQFLGLAASFATLLLVFVAVITLAVRGYHLPTFI